MVIILLAEGFEEVEAITTVDYLRRGDIDIKTVSITADKNVKGAHGIKVVCDETLDEVDESKVEMVILPGGMTGCDNLAKSESIKTLLGNANDKGKYIAAICAAPSIVLKSAGILNDDIKLLCYPDEELKSLLGGNIYENFEGEKVIVSKNVISSKCPNTAIDFALKIIEVLKGEGAKREVENDVKGL